MIHVRTLSGQETPLSSLGPERPPQGVWVRVERPTPDEVQLLRALFALHPLALEDALEEGHWSRFESYPEHDFLTYRTLSRPSEGEEFSERVSLFIFPQAILSFSLRDLSYADKVWKMVGRESVNTPAEVAYELIDHGTDTFLIYATTLEDQIDSLQEQVFRDPRLDVTATVFELKHHLSEVRRLALEGRDAALLLTRHSHAESGDLIRYRDALSNVDRAVSRLDAQRESLSNLLDMYLGFQSQRMNQVMRTLTTVSTIFLPLTFLAGVWGMNFQHIPELHWKYGYLLAWASFLLTAALMGWYFKRRDWW